MAGLVNRIQQAILGGAGENKVRSLLTELAIPSGGSGERAMQRIRLGILYDAPTESQLRDAFGSLGLTGSGTGKRPLPRMRAAIFGDMIDSEGILRGALNDLLAPGQLTGGASAVGPTDIAWAGSHTIAEGAALGTTIGGTLSATDPGDVVTFSLADDAGGLFGVSGNSVIVTGVIDYETATSHNITIRATDKGGLTFDEVFAVTVTDVDETPPPPELEPGSDTEIIVDDPDNYEVPPTVVAVDDAIAFQGNKKKGSTGKFVYDIGVATAGGIYTMQYDPDWSLLENGGKTAMVGFGLRTNNDFRLSGLKGNGSTGLKAQEIFGANKWDQTSGFSFNDGGAATHGTQGGPNWLQFEVAPNGSKYTVRTSADGAAGWVDAFTNITPAPFASVVAAATFGIAVFLDASDDGPFRIDITLWEVESALPIVNRTALYLSQGIY